MINIQDKVSLLVADATTLIIDFNQAAQNNSIILEMKEILIIKIGLLQGLIQMSLTIHLIEDSTSFMTLFEETILENITLHQKIFQS